MTFRVLEGHDIFASTAACLVNAVNCRGIMGAGIAKAFADRWPNMLPHYRRACSEYALLPGRVHVYYTSPPVPTTETTFFIANVATMTYPGERAALGIVMAGILALASEVARHNIRSVAIPALGCGIGGLDVVDVARVTRDVFTVLPSVQVEFYASRPGERPSS